MSGLLANEHNGRLGRSLLALTGVGATAVAANYFLLWPWMRRWGATDIEVQMALPGDDLIPNPTLQTTQAITVQAPPSAIYPWLLQLGVDRGGMYSYDWLENLFGLRVETVDHIVPAWQNVQVGDFIRFTPHDYRLKPGPGLYVLRLESNRALVGRFGLEGKPDDLAPMSWQFVLESQPDGATRLLLRSRTDMANTAPIKHTYFAQFLMQRKMLLGIKERAERFTGA